MAAELSVDEAVERAMRAQEVRIESIRALAKGRQSLADVKTDAAQKLAALERENAEQISAAERDDVRLYSAATKAGWTADELRKIGFDEPLKAARVRRKRSSVPAVADGDHAPHAGAQ